MEPSEVHSDNFTEPNYRLEKDTHQVKIMTLQNKDFSGGPVSRENPFVWEVCVRGEKDTYWKKGYFKFSIVLPTDYPISTPSITAISKMFHPNISPTDGRLPSHLIHWTEQSTIVSML